MAVAQRAISVQNRPLEKRGGPTRIVCLDTSYGWTFGSEDDTATNFTPLTNFIVLPNGFLPSRVKLKDRFCKGGRLRLHPANISDTAIQNFKSNLRFCKVGVAEDICNTHRRGGGPNAITVGKRNTNYA